MGLQPSGPGLRHFQTIQKGIVPFDVTALTERDQGQCLKVVVKPSQLVTSDLFQRMKARFGAFKIQHMLCQFIVSAGPDDDKAANNIPICFTSCVIIPPEEPSSSLVTHAGSDDATKGPYNDVALVYNSESALN